MKLGPRYSLPFVCKTDLDLIKEMNGEAILDRRTSLLMMNERNRTRHSMVEDFNKPPLEKKISTGSMKEGKQYERKRASHNMNKSIQFSIGSSNTLPISKKSSKENKKLKGISTSHIL